MLLGVSGPIGLAQRFEWELTQQQLKGPIVGKPAVEIGSILREAFWTKVLANEYAVAAATQPVLGSLAQQDALSAILLVVPSSDRAELIQFDHCSAAEVASDELPFASIGSGQTIADPFLAFLKRVFWPNRAPTLNEGNFSALWTIRHAIRVNPGGIAAPAALYNLVRKDGNWVPRQLDKNDLEEHEVAVAAAEDHLRGFTRGTTSAGPPPPSP